MKYVSYKKYPVDHTLHVVNNLVVGYIICRAFKATAPVACVRAEAFRASFFSTKEEYIHSNALNARKELRASPTDIIIDIIYVDALIIFYSYS